MNSGQKIQLSEDFLKMLEGESSLFLYKERAKIPESLDDMVLHYCNFFSGTMIHAYYNEPSYIIKDTTDRKVVAVSISRNLTTSMIKLERMISGKNHFILLDSLDEIAMEVGKKPCFRFLSILLKKSREQKGTVVSFFRLDPFIPNSGHYITRSFDNVFEIDGKGIQKHESKDQPCTDYPLSDESSTDSEKNAEMEKIKNIFKLTPEEQEELDKIVGDSIKDFSIS